MYRTQTLWSHCNLILRAFCHCVYPAPRREEVQSIYQRNGKLFKKLDTVTKIRIVNDLFEYLKRLKQTTRLTELVVDVTSIYQPGWQSYSPDADYLDQKFCK